MTILVICSLFLCAQQGASAEEVRGEELFARRIAPLFKERCLVCHGEDPKGKLKGGYDMRSRDVAVRGGDSGEPALVAGKAESSPLYLAVTREHADDWKPMPPKENDRLTREQVAWIRDWIAAGAPWPDAARISELTKANEDKWSAADGVAVKTSGGLAAHWTSRRYEDAALWAYRPVKKPSLPDSDAANPIDAFLNAAMRVAKVEPAPPADVRTFIRRATFDLTGLPPTPEEVEAFVRACGESGLSATSEKLIARLLASPHYGERQAQHWLDVARYADTSGGSNDFERPGVWRYRDYVVRSFNGDKPYDRFIVEQLAGDALAPDDPAMAVATGFLRMGPWEATAMNNADVTRQMFLDDVVNHVGETFLAQALRCAKCHDHKFDPVPTRDYYSMMAVFADTHPTEREAAFVSGEVKPDGAEEKARVQHVVAGLTAELDALGRKHFDAGIAWLREHGTDTAKVKFVGDGFFNTFNTFFGAVPDEKRPPKNIGLSPDEITRIAVLAKQRGYLERSLDRFEPVAFTVYSGPPNDYASTKRRNAPEAGKKARKNPPMHILGGGSIESPLNEVPPGILSGVASLAGVEARFENGVPPRLALAHWIADARNPLTTRAIVNRVWQQHFGRGLAATPNNFGKMGARPSHPELLDFLASWFVENGWSLKRLHTLICTSEAYRRSARHPSAEALTKADPGGALHAVFPVRRLTAEEMRDAMLAVSGELNPALGGPPVFPEINLEAALQPRYVMSGIGPAYQPSPRPADRHRRTLYSFRMRGLSDPMLEVFNRPNADLSCERRDSTTVTTQVFSLLNGVQSNGRALALATRLERETREPSQRVARAYALVFGRAPSEIETARALAHLQKMTAFHRAEPLQPVAPPKAVRRSMVGEMTGTVQEWDEPLDIFAHGFVPDLQPWDVSPETRALADLCLVLFNSNAFLYLE